jgi:hypothetical protein
VQAGAGCEGGEACYVRAIAAVQGAQLDEGTEIDALQGGVGPCSPALHARRHAVDSAPQLFACEPQGPIVGNEDANRWQNVVRQIEEREGQILLHVDDGDEGGDRMALRQDRGQHCRQRRTVMRFVSLDQQQATHC